MTERVTVELPGQPGRSYDVVVGERVLADELEGLGELLGRRPGRAFLVVDANVPEEVVRTARAGLTDGGWLVGVHAFEPSEGFKTLATLREVLAAIEAHRLERGEPVVALGGGVVGDVAGFAAACYRRGTPVVQCPTTLLAMVDASVGGKTGVNLDPDGAALLKNAVGAFHQPARVIADVAALDSLPAREVRCGLAECLKHGMLSGSAGDETLLTWTEARLERLRSLDGTAMVELVRRNVAVKAAVVAGDERETAAVGGRATLNLGHTFAHSIEPVAELSPTDDPADAPLKHGEAVGLGLIAASATASAHGLVGSEFVSRVRGLVELAGLPTRVRGLPDDAALLAAMGHDKKVRSERIRFVLPVGSGQVSVFDDVRPEAVSAGLTAIRAAAP